jgi:hypothetical protein
MTSETTTTERLYLVKESVSEVLDPGIGLPRPNRQIVVRYLGWLFPEAFSKVLQDYKYSQNIFVHLDHDGT